MCKKGQTQNASSANLLSLLLYTIYKATTLFVIAYQNKKHTFNWLNTPGNLHYTAIQTGILI